MLLNDVREVLNDDNMLSIPITTYHYRDISFQMIHLRFHLTQMHTKYDNNNNIRHFSSKFQWFLKINSLLLLLHSFVFYAFPCPYFYSFWCHFKSITNKTYTKLSFTFLFLVIKLLLQNCILWKGLSKWT